MTDIQNTQDARTCLECEKPFTASRTDQRFCGRPCKDRFIYNQKKYGNSADNLAAESSAGNGRAAESSAGNSAGNGRAAESSAGNKLAAESHVVQSAGNSAGNGATLDPLGGKTPSPEDLVKRGKLVKTVAYAAAMFEWHFKLRVRYNEFGSFYEIWDTGRDKWRQLSDSDLLVLRCQTGQEYLDEYNSAMTHDACKLIGDKYAYDPLKDALGALEWDGVERVGRWVETYLGAANDPLTAIQGRRFLISAVSRAMLDSASLGSKVDTAFVLVGGQGTLKSTVFRVLAEALVPGSYLDDFYFGMEAKETLEQGGGKFIVEDAEIRALNGRGRGHVKQSLSKQSDKARMAYGRIAVEKPRRFVIVGSTNEDDFLEDATGSRRFWIVKVGKIDLEALRRDVSQLWAEAKMLWKSGEKWWLDTEEEVRNDCQNLDYMSDDPWLDLLLPVLGNKGDGYMSAEGVAKLIGIPAVYCDAGVSRRIARVMKQMRFNRTRIRVDGHSRRGYVRGKQGLNGGAELIDTSNLYVAEWGKIVKKKDDSIL